MFLKTLFVNGKIFTGGKTLPYADAMSVSLGGIDCIGTTKDVLESVGATSLYDEKLKEFTVVDLQEKTVIPGIVEINGSPIVTTKTGNGDISLSEETRLAGDLVNGLQVFAENGIVAMAEMGTNLTSFLPDDLDIFQCYTEASERGLPQYVSCYYPWAAIKDGANPVEDKSRLIRNRKVHVAGIAIKKTDMLTSEELDQVIEFCKNNYLQLSIDSDATETIEMMRERAAREDDWLQDVGVPPVRIKYTMRSENPFENIGLTVNDLVNQHGLDSRLAVESAVRLYTSESAQLAGFLGVGELKLGSGASFMILPIDIFAARGDDIMQVKPEAVYIDGRCIYATA